MAKKVKRKFLVKAIPGARRRLLWPSQSSSRPLSSKFKRCGDGLKVSQPW